MAREVYPFENQTAIFVWMNKTMAAQAWAVVTAMQQGLRAFDMAKVGSTFHQFSDPYQE